MISNEQYVKQKMKSAKMKIIDTLGNLKRFYSYQDVFKIFTTYGWVEELEFEELPDYIQAGTANFDSIEGFTKGFIKGNSYKIYAIRMEKHFNIFVLGLEANLLLKNYYSHTITDETLEICYLLEEMISEQ